MKTYITQDGERFEVRTARDLLRQMRARSPLPEANYIVWLRNLKRRVGQTEDVRLGRGESALVAKLIELELIKEE